MRSYTMMGLLALALLSMLAGCRRGRMAVENPRHLARYEQQLTRLAARDSGCPPHAVQPYRIGETLWTANTCSGPREYLLQCGRGRRWRSCRWIRVGSAPEAAAPVLGCPPQAMQQQPGPSPTSRVVMGCGRQVLMGIGCGPGGCGWMPTAPVAGAAPPPPPGYGAAPPPGYGGAPPSSGGQVILVPAN